MYLRVHVDLNNIFKLNFMS